MLWVLRQPLESHKEKGTFVSFSQVRGRSNCSGSVPVCACCFGSIGSGEEGAQVQPPSHHELAHIEKQGFKEWRCWTCTDSECNHMLIYLGTSPTEHSGSYFWANLHRIVHLPLQSLSHTKLSTTSCLLGTNFIQQTYTFCLPGHKTFRSDYKILAHSIAWAILINKYNGVQAWGA